MQKKVAMILVGGLVACLIGGCGQSEVSTDTMATVDETIAEGTEVTEEDGQAEEFTEEADTVGDEETVSDSSTDESVEENGDDGTSESAEFPDISEFVLEQDNSDEYGVYSTSCFDLDQYLDDNGALQGWDDFESSIYTEYSGRWAYPELTPCRFFNELSLFERVDASEVFYAYDSETEHNGSIRISSGLYEYHHQKDSVGLQIDNDLWTPPEIMFTAQTSEGEVEVLCQCIQRRASEVKLDADGNIIESDEESTRHYYDYYYPLGSFSINISGFGEKLTKEEVQLIIDNIHLTNGKER